MLDQLLGGTDAAAALQEGGLLDGLKKALTERALNAEMDHHLGSEAGIGNSRNGQGRQAITTDTGERIALKVPRDRQASFARPHERTSTTVLGAGDGRAPHQQHDLEKK